MMYCSVPFLLIFFHFQCFLYLFLLFLNESGLCNAVVCDGGLNKPAITQIIAN